MNKDALVCILETMYDALRDIKDGLEWPASEHLGYQLEHIAEKLREFREQE